jgi:LysM repeat protein
MFSWFSGTRMALVVLCAVCSLSMLGCGVSQDDFNELSKQRDQLNQELSDVKTRCESQNKEAETVLNELDTARKRNSELDKSNKKLTERVAAYKKLLQENAPDVDLEELEKPKPTGQYKEYEVKQGDSLWSIAHENGSSVDLIKEANNLEDIKLKLGQILQIPIQGNSDSQ